MEYLRTGVALGDDHTLRHESMDDVYFSKEDGFEETRHVFLGGNDLAHRFTACDDAFVIAEAGFGTGLNYAAACECWKQHAPEAAKIHYISFEKEPLAPDIIHGVLSHWPSIAPWRDALLAHYPLPIEGPHRIAMDHGSLTLVWGDIHRWLPEMAFKADAWFLDGFAPKKNPHMWEASLLEQVGMHTGPDGTVATFTAASDVRRGLEAAGFAISKVPGFGRKREMITGVKHG